MPFFEKLTQDVLETAEKMVKVLEEGSAILMGKHAQFLDNKKRSEGTLSKKEPHSDFDGFGADDIMMGSPLDGMAESVLNDIIKNQAVPETFAEQIQAFKAAIRWEEPFIISLLIFQAMMLFTTFRLISFKKENTKTQMTFLVIIFVLVRSAERLNNYASDNWERISTQNYFDRRGVFVSVMFSAPLLLCALIMLLAYMREASHLLVEVKRMELQRKKKMEQQNIKKKKENVGKEE